MARLSKKELRANAMDTLECLTDCGPNSYTNKDGVVVTNGQLFKGYAMLSDNQLPVLNLGNKDTNERSDKKLELIVSNVAIKFEDADGNEKVLVKTAKMTAAMCDVMILEGETLDKDELYYVYVQEVPATDKDGVLREGFVQHFVSLTPFTDGGDGAYEGSFATAVVKKETPATALPS